MNRQEKAHIHKYMTIDLWGEIYMDHSYVMNYICASYIIYMLEHENERA